MATSWTVAITVGIVVLVILTALVAAWTRRKPKDPLRDALRGLARDQRTRARGTMRGGGTAQDSDIFSGSVGPNW